MAVVWGKTATPSDDPADYAGHWQKVTGADGTDGQPGPAGADGRTSYFHTAWADDVSGQSGFTVSGGDGKKYIGTYSDFTLADSTNPADYNWALFKGKDGDVGPKGPQGLPGTNGSDGRTTYAHFAYANSQDGNTDFSTTDSNRKYIGFYSDFSSGDSTNPSAYNWSLIKGADGADGKDGVPGKAGADGRTPYFHIAYSDSSDGNTNFSSDTPGSRKYIGSYTDFTQADSTNPADYSWQLVQGPKGDTGKDGVAGKDGVGIKSTQIMYAQSTSGTTAPTTGWTAQVPTLIKGQHLWTQTTWAYTDNTGEAGYTVSYNAKDGNTGANGIAGKDGVGITVTAVTYQSSTSGVTPPTGTWSTSIPSVDAGNYLWTRTVWSYTDGTSETGYSVGKIGDTGQKGERGKQIFKSSYEGNPNQAGRYWSDLSPAPSVDNPPKIGDTVITPAGNILQIDTVIVGGGGGGGTFGVGDVLGNIQGPAGNDITSYASGTTLPTAVAPANSQFWLTNSAGVAIKFYKSTGTAWAEQQISAAAINAATFNGLSFTGVTFNGSTFNSTFTNVQPDGATFTVHGTSTLENGALSTTAYKDSDNSLYSTTNVSPVDIGSVLYDSGTKFDEIRLREGQLYLGGLYKDSASSNPYWQDGVLTPAQLLALQRSGTVVWTGLSFMQDGFTVTPSLSLGQCLFGWSLIWQPYDGTNASNDGGIMVTTVYKSVALNVGKTHAWNWPLISYNHGNASLTKYVYVTSDGTKLLGSSNNNADNSRYYVLTKVVAF